MKSASKTIEILIKKALAQGNISQAEQLAKSVNRKLKTAETDKAIACALKSKKMTTWNISNIISGRKVSKSLLEKVVARAVREGNIYVAFDTAAQLNRALTQPEVDGIYGTILKSKKTPEQKGKDINTVLWCDVSNNRMHNRLQVDLNPSAKVGNKLMQLCLDHDLEKACRDLLWLRRGRKDNINQELIDAFIEREFKKRQSKPGNSFITDTPFKEVLAMASPDVVKKIIAKVLKTTDDAYTLFNYASCDSSQESYVVVIDRLCKVASKLKGASESYDYLKKTNEWILRSADKVEVAKITAGLEKWMAINTKAGQWYNNFLTAQSIELPVAMRDSVFNEMKANNAFYRCRDLYLERGGPDSIRDWVIANISVPGSIGIGDQFHPDDVFKMGGTEAINKLIADMLNQKNIYPAIHVAEKHYTPVETREKVIAEAVTDSWAYHSIEKMLLANRREPTQSEIDQVFQNMIKKVSENESLYLEYALDMLPHKPTKGLEEPLVTYLKKKNRLPQLINLLKAVGRESEIAMLA